MKKQYPIIKIPSSYIDAQKSEIPIPDSPEEPTKPIKDNADSSGFLAVGVGVVIVEAINGASIETIGITIALITTLIYYIKDVSDTKQKFEKNMAVYYEEKQNWLKECEKHKINIKNIRNKADTASYRKKQLAELLKEIRKPKMKVKGTKVGLAESYFYQHLKIEFNNSIHKDYILDKFKYNRAYEPDFILQDIDSGLHIDIEIDEPYVLKDGKPIHYLDKDNLHIDEERDDYFNLNNWIVIRFAEIQVLEYPEECCKIIRNVLNEFKENWLNVSYVDDEYIKVDCWTRNEAINMANKKVRQSYLNGKVIDYLTTNSSTDNIILEPEKFKEDEYDDLPF